MRRLRVILLALVIGLLPALGSLLPQSVYAANVTVADGTDYPCTKEGLEDAVGDANGFTVTFDCDDPTIEMGGYIRISNDMAVAIDGSNNGNPIVLNAQNNTYHFFVDKADGNQGTLNLQNLTLQNGSTDSYGGAIWSQGKLTVNHVNFLSNSAAAYNGGAIYNQGTLNVSFSSFIGNDADFGGAIHSQQGKVTISQSTFDSNTSTSNGGAIYTASAKVTINQSTFIGNQADGAGGALAIFSYQAGEITVSSSTFSDNTSQNGSAIYLGPDYGSRPTVRWSTIIQAPDTAAALSFNTATILTGVILGGDGTAHCSGNPGNLSDSYSLANDSSCELGDEGSDQALEDLGLEEIATEVIEGVTQSYYPLDPNSPAIDRGPATCTSPDQLGTVRPYGDGTCDAGAFELANNLPKISSIAVEPTGKYAEGDEVTVTINATDADIDDSLTYSIDCGNDGTWELADSATTSKTTCQLPDQGDYTIAGKVSDGEANVTSTTTLTVTNRDPVISTFTGTPNPANVNEPIILNVQTTDVLADTVILDIDCGGGTFDPQSTSCTYSVMGSYTITLVANDQDGGHAKDTLEVSIIDTIDLCANRWDGDLRMPQVDRCYNTETPIYFSDKSPDTICANRWTGDARYSVYGRCRSTESTYRPTGDNSIPVCVNRWTGDLRIDNRCYTTERSDQL